MSKESHSFYTPVWSFRGFQLAKRPDSPNLYIVWYLNGKFRKQSTRTANLDRAKEFLMVHIERSEYQTGPKQISEPHTVLIDDVLGYYLERHITESSPSRKITQANLVSIRMFLVKYQLTHVHQLEPDVMDLYREFREERYTEYQLRRYLGYKKYRGCSPKDLLHKVKPISEGTIGRELSVLNAALRFYQKRQKIVSVPFIQMPPPPPARSRWLTPTEYAILFENADTQNLRDFMELLIRTLQRPGFIFDLEINQIDLPRRRIAFLKRGARQTNKRRPDIRISELLVPLLERRIRESQSGYLLEYQGQRIQDMGKSFRNAASRAGLHRVNDPDCDRVIPYTLRHTGATWLAQAGIDLWQISGMLGHRDTRMVERVYAKHHPDFQKKAVEMLDRLVPDQSNDLCANHAPNRVQHERVSDGKIDLISNNTLKLQGDSMVGGRRFELPTPTMSRSNECVKALHSLTNDPTDDPDS